MYAKTILSLSVALLIAIFTYVILSTGCKPAHIQVFLLIAIGMIIGVLLNLILRHFLRS